jgi:transposase
MPRGRPRKPLSLAGADREALWELSQHAPSHRVRRRAKMILFSARRSNDAVATHLKTWPQTVARWRERFRHYGLEGLRDAPRPGAPRRLNQRTIARVVRIAGSEPPAHLWQWSIRTAAHHAGVSKTTVWRIWKERCLRPTQTHTPFYYRL